MKSQLGKKNLAGLLIKDSPVGPLFITTGRSGISKLKFCDDEEITYLLMDYGSKSNEQGFEILERAEMQLNEYFNGKRMQFDLPVDILGETVFTQRVLEKVMNIPFGSVLSYGAVAGLTGNPESARAVGGAVARNPIPIIIPCHRVVSSRNELHGYSAPGGIGLKAKLLKHEGVLLDKDRVIT